MNWSMTTWAPLTKSPNCAGVGLGGGVAVLVGQHRLLGEGRVDDQELRLVRGDVLQRHVGVPVHLVVEHGMAVEEGAPAAVLARETHRVAVGHQGGVGQGLGEAPVAHLVALGHLAALEPDLVHAGVELEPRRYVEQPQGELSQALAGEAGVDRVVPFDPSERLPVHGEGVADTALHLARHGLAVFDGRSVLGLHLLDLGFGDHPLVDQLVGVELPYRRVGADLAVHHGLGHGRLVRLVVAVAAVADHVDDHVLAELAAEVEREAGGEYHRLGVVAVHVEDRRLHHLGHVGAVEGGAGVERVGGGEADLVVDDDVDRAARGVAPGLGQVERLHHHALTGEGRVAVDQERQDLLALAVAAPLLAGAHRPLDDGADDGRG